MLLTELIAGRNLSREQTNWAMDVIMSGSATDSQIAGFLVALRAKKETVEELAGLADAMLEKANPLPFDGEALDIVGTGGDRLNTVNISTMAALVCAGAGVRIVKHGNRASSSTTGSADVLEALGVRLDLPIDSVAHAAAEVGITFCFAQVFHPSFRYTSVPRREMAIPTALNFLGPLTNPGRVSASAVGVADARMAPLLAGVLAERGSRGLVFRGDDGLDELTITTSSRVWEFREGTVTESTLDPRELGLPLAQISDLQGKDATYNAETARELLRGKPGPVRNAVLLNAAAGLVSFDAESSGPLEERMRVALQVAGEAVDSGAAAQALERWVAFSSAQ
ncbi:anthranilate phosphoribosyltransferase [Psychromicrobium xiongbiense]|uniref:anthranilate phosphoribosyltransferase n=1 Tax=Psychromicrobium xiongbiense TaxID=3051184 RepID=UPI002555E419|nr:anthranilate phosphoribosyltransferase [Psychromicrobium sp. YIM S02556]